MKKSKISNALNCYLWITIGSVIYAIGFDWLYVPNGIGFGGITSLGQILNYYVPALPIGMVVLVANIPLFLLGWRLLGGHLLISSLYAMLVSSVFVDLLDRLAGLRGGDLGQAVLHRDDELGLGLDVARRAAEATVRLVQRIQKGGRREGTDL